MAGRRVGPGSPVLSKGGRAHGLADGRRDLSRVTGDRLLHEAARQTAPVDLADKPVDAKPPVGRGFGAEVLQYGNTARAALGVAPAKKWVEIPTRSFSGWPARSPAAR